MNITPIHSNEITAVHTPASHAIINSISIKELKRKWEDRQIVIPTYQRNSVWSSAQKRAFIMAILDGETCIPNLAIHVEDSKWNIVDGQQRTRTIVEYMEDRIALPKHLLAQEGLHESLAGKFSKLPDDAKEAFLDYSLDFKMSRYPRKSFLRLQNAKPLTNAEKNHALECDLNDCLQELAREFADFFALCAFSDRRFKVEEVLSGCLYIVVNGHAARNRQDIARFYQTFSYDTHGDAVERTQSIMEALRHTITEKQAFLGAANLRAIFLLLHLADQVEDYLPHLNAFLKACADKEHLKARNRPGEEHLQKDALAAEYRTFIQKVEAISGGDDEDPEQPLS